MRSSKLEWGHQEDPGEAGGFPGGTEVKASACNVGDLGSFPGSGRSLEKEMATHSSMRAWRIPWTEELGGLQSMGRKESDTTEPLHFTSNTALLLWQGYILLENLLFKLRWTVNVKYPSDFNDLV